jgi:hypothetical protein
MYNKYRRQEREHACMLDNKKPILPHLQQPDQAPGHPDQPAFADSSDFGEASLKEKSRTAKQRQASPVNGRKSHGPISPEGKQKAAQNAVRDGIFSRQIVIEELGETPEEFDRLRTTLFDCIQPHGALEEQMAMDFTENMFLRERVRRAAEQERGNRLQAFQLESELRRSDQLDKLRHQFLVQLEDHLSDGHLSYVGVPIEIEETRRELMASSDGVDFLLELLEQVEPDPEINEVLSAKQRMVLHAIRGCGHPLDVRSRIERLTTDNNSAAGSTEAPSARKDPRGEQNYREDDLAPGDEPLRRGSSALARKGFAALINSVAESLTARKEKLKRIEDAETQKQIGLIMLDPSPSERFSRAETSRERKMYRALGAIAALRATATSSPLSLPLPVHPEHQELPGLRAKRTREAPSTGPTAILAEQATMLDTGPLLLLDNEVPPPPS